MKKVYQNIIRMIALSALAFAPACLTAQSDSFNLKEVLLKEVVIQQGSAQANQKDFVPGKNVRTNTDQLLSQIGGINMIRRGNYAWEAGIRGLTGGRISTTIDGMAIFGACTDKMDPVSSYIEPTNLKSISISYGSSEDAPNNTIGGGIDFKIHQPALYEKKKFSGMLASGYETNGSGRKLMTSLNYGEKKLGINVNGIYRAADSYRAGGGQRIRFSQYEKWNGGIGLKYRLNDHNTVLLNYIRDEGYNIGYPALTMDVLYAKANILSFTHQLHFGSGVVNRLDTRVYFNTIDHAMDDTKRPPDEVHMHMDMPGRSRTAGLLSVARGRAGSHFFRAKLNAYQNELHADMTMYPHTGAPMFMLTLPDVRRDYAEVSVHDDWNVSERFAVSFAASQSMARSSVFTEDGKQAVSATLSQAMPRTDLLTSVSATPVYFLRKDLSASFSIGYNMRSPTLQELYGLYLFDRADNFDYLGSPDLENETSVNMSLGLRYANDQWRISGSIFSYQMKHFITGTPDPSLEVMTHGASGVKRFGNIHKAMLNGFEAEGQWTASATIQLSSINSFSYGRDNAGDPLPLIPPFRSVTSAILKWKNFDFRPMVIINAAQQRVSEKYAERTTPSSLIANFYIDRVFIFGSNRVSITAGVENLMDARYSEHADLMKVWRPGRNVLLQLGWMF